MSSVYKPPSAPCISPWKNAYEWIEAQELYSEVYGTLFLTRFQKIDFNVLLCFIDQTATKCVNKARVTIAQKIIPFTDEHEKIFYFTISSAKLLQSKFI
jgi:hypothetical protein